MKKAKDNLYFKVSNSKLKTFRQCPKSYEFKYMDRIQPLFKSVALIRGEIVHSMIESYSPGMDLEEVFATELDKKLRFAALGTLPQGYSREEIKDILDGKKKISPAEMKKVETDVALYLQSEEMEEAYMTLPIMKGYFDHYGDNSDLKPYYWKDQCHEIHFEIPIKKDVLLEGYIDMLVQDKYGEVWIMDHKTNKTPQRGVIKSNLQQGVIYYLAAKYLGIPVKGVIWNWIRWKVPSVPDVLKNGELSKRKNIDTTWAVYKQAVLDNGLDPEDYKDMEVILDGKEEAFYTREYETYPQTMVDTIRKDLIKTVDEMRYFESRGEGIRNLCFSCGTCNYKDICFEQLSGLPIDEILKSRYLVNKVKDQDPLQKK